MFERVRRWMKRLIPADRFHRLDISKPAGRENLQIWTARTLDAKPLGYLLTAGRLAQPVAFIFSREADRIAYRTARAIADDMLRAGNETPMLFDLRAFDWESPGHLAFILDLVLFPTDHKGGGVFETNERELFGGMLDYAGGMRFALTKNGHRRHTRTAIPIFKAPIATDGWSSVPTDLKLHLDSIDPQTKNGGPSPESEMPGQPETLKAIATAA